MNISIEVTEPLLDFLDSKVREGLYKSRSEMVRCAIREMIQKDLEEQLRAIGLTPEKFKKLRDEVGKELRRTKHKQLAVVDD